MLQELCQRFGRSARLLHDTALSKVRPRESNRNTTDGSWMTNAERTYFGRAPDNSR